MKPRNLILAAAALLAAAAAGTGSAYALSEHEIIRMHEACRAGDHAACVRHNIAIHEHEHEHEWRRIHPEWYR